MLRLLCAMVCAATLLFAGVEAQAQITDIVSAVNKAGLQRMLSQQIAKLYLQIGQNIDAERSRRNFDTAIALFDRQLVELKNYAPTPQIRDLYLELEKKWLAYKDVLLGAPPSRDRARRVLELSDETLALAHEATQLLEQHGGVRNARLVNLAGRQRMLSQRMAKFYQAALWNVVPGGGKTELEQSRREFVTALAELENSPVNTQTIQDELQLVRAQWIFFEQALQAKGTDKTHALNAATTSERILESMNHVTDLYERLLAER